MSISRLSTANRDYLTFLDGGSKVPYHQDNTKYIPTPYNIIESIDFENKKYINASSGYYVGTRLSNFVRSITAQDYKYVKAQVQPDKIISKAQLVMEFS